MNNIMYNYIPSKNIQKQYFDFYLWSYLYMTSGKKSNYSSYNLNKNLLVILTKATKKISQIQKKLLCEIIISYILIELTKKDYYKYNINNKLEKFLDKLKKSLSKIKNIYSYKEYYKEINKAFYDNGLCFENIINAVNLINSEHLSTITQKFINLNESKEIRDIFFCVDHIYSFLERNNLLFILPKTNENWKNLISINRNNSNIWAIIKRSSIPQRVIGHMVNYKGLKNREELLSKSSISSQKINIIKFYSYKFLCDYFKNKSSRIKRELKKYPNISKLSMDELKNLISQDSIEKLLYDSVYNNKNIVERTEEGFVKPFAPFRYYEYLPRKELAIELNSNSLYKNLLEFYLEDKKIPYSIIIQVPIDFEDSKKDFIKKYNLIVPVETEIDELEKLELNLTNHMYKQNQ
ncbi:MAG: hypothetical protein ACOCV1_02500 [Bacillota bacterium]